MKLLRTCMYCLLVTSLPRSVLGFAPSRAIRATKACTKTAASSYSSSSLAMNENDHHHEKSKLSIAILGGGIAGLSCASRLLTQHKKSYVDPSSSSSSSRYELEVTVFDTGRLRPGGRCSSRLPGDAPAVAKGGGGGTSNHRNDRRACDNEGTTSNNNGDGEIPDNIRRALAGAANDAGTNASRDRIVNGMGPVDHAAQMVSIPDIDSPLDEFRSQLQEWLEEGVVESFPEDSVCELIDENEGGEGSSRESKLQPLEGEMYYGKGGMGNIPIAMREHCLSFNQFGDNYTGQSFRILQDVWVSPSNGVKYIGNHDDANEGDEGARLWELRAGKKSLGKYHRLVIAHNGKCADRIMSRTPARAFHSLLRTRFAPYVPRWGGREMTLNSIYSLAFAVKSKKDGGGGDDACSPIVDALSKLSSSSQNGKNIYTVMIKNEPSLRLLSCNTSKHHHEQNPNSDSNIEVFTLLSSPQFGKKFKGPQENLPPDLVEKVTVKLLRGLERSLDVREGSVIDSVVDLKLQLWGAGVPVNTWKTTSSDGGADGFVYDAAHGVGAAGDWILDPSVAGAWESGRRLASWMLTENEENGGSVVRSVGLPADRSSPQSSSSSGGEDEGEGGRFVPSLAALGSGIGTVPSSPGSRAFEFPSSEETGRSRGPGPSGSRNGRGRGRGGRGGRGRGRGRGGRGGGGRSNRAGNGKREGNNNEKRTAQPASQ